VETRTEVRAAPASGRSEPFLRVPRPDLVLLWLAAMVVYLVLTGTSLMQLVQSAL